MIESLYWAMPVAFAAGLMRGFAGFGSGMLMAPFFIQFFGPVQMIILIAVMEFIVTLQLLPSVYRLIDRSLVLSMSVVATLSMPIGTWLLLTLDPKIVSIGVGAIVLSFSVSLMRGWQYRGPRPRLLSCSVGAFSGVLLASTSLGNPPVILYLMSSDTSAAKVRANLTGYFGVTLIGLGLWMGSRGFVTLDAGYPLLWLTPAFVIGAWLGARLFRVSSEQVYRRIALVALCLAGLYALFAS